jgi:hypothetical protein
MMASLDVKADHRALLLEDLKTQKSRWAAIVAEADDVSV